MSPLDFDVHKSRPNATAPTPASAFAWEIDATTGGVAIARFLDEAATVCVVPPRIDGRPVETIGESAFRDATSLTTVCLPEGVRTIAADAFYGCAALASLDLPETLETIGACAFENCVALRSVVLPKSLRTLGDGAFYGCSALESIDFPKTLEKIGVATFCA